MSWPILRYPQKKGETKKTEEVERGSNEHEAGMIIKGGQ